MDKVMYKAIYDGKVYAIHKVKMPKGPNLVAVAFDLDSATTIVEALNRYKPMKVKLAPCMNSLCKLWRQTSRLNCYAVLSPSLCDKYKPEKG